MRKPELHRYAPVGMRLNTELWAFFLGLVIAVLFSLCFFVELGSAYNQLFQRLGDQRVLIPGAVMPDFDTLSLPWFVPFGILTAITLSFIFPHYGCHHQGSKSIYLMRRLADPWELHRRCLTLPLAGVGVCLLLAFMLLLLYFAVYLGVTPEECLTPNQWQKIWR